MKYRLKKELPGMPAGAEVECTDPVTWPSFFTGNPNNYPDWFEPVTEKTVREWFEELPEGYRALAFGNTRLGSLDNVKESMADAIAYAFTWSNTRQGHKFWWQVEDHYTKGTPLPPLPVTEPAYTAHSFKVGDWVMFDGHKWQVTDTTVPLTLYRVEENDANWRKAFQAYAELEAIVPIPAPHVPTINPGDTVTWQGHTGKFLGFDGEDACFSVNYAPYVIRANPWELEKVGTDGTEDEKETSPSTSPSEPAPKKHGIKPGQMFRVNGRTYIADPETTEYQLYGTEFGENGIRVYSGDGSSAEPVDVHVTADSRQDEEKNNTPQERADTHDSLLDSPAFKDAVRRIIREELP